eukprot:55815_1
MRDDVQDEDEKNDLILNEDPIESEAEDNEHHHNNEWLDNPKRIRFIICACIVFIIMTFIILLQLYSDNYGSWISYDEAQLERRTDGFIVSPTDTNRSFEMITLSNGLEVLIISDSSTDKSAAAIDVGIGSSSDPLSYLGLAHFHEHMLFLGSHTYSSLDSFSSYISMSGGSDNAFTENKHTNFFFSVDNDKFEHSLDIFSHFFIDPLLTKKSMKDEIWAVDNEYRKDLPSQAWRDWRMFEYSANKHHSFHKFTVGSLQTLDSKSADVYDAMKAFHNKYVVANIMKAVVYGREDVATLTKWAKDKFSHIVSNKSLQIDDDGDEGTPYRVGKETSKIYYIETVSKQKQITYFWGIYGFKLHEDYRTPVLSFINDHLLQSATNNSLYNILKIKLQLITSMDCDEFYSETEWSGNAISFELTDKGTQNIDLITSYLYKYLDLLLSKTHEEARLFAQYFAESQCIDALYFNYYSLIKKAPYTTVSGLAKRMQFRAHKDLLYLSLNVIPQRLIFNLSLISSVLSFMANPRHVMMHYTNDDFDVSNFDEKEPFFNIKFHSEAIDIEVKQSLEYELEIPPLNPYILGNKGRQCSWSGDSKLLAQNNQNKDVELVVSEASMQVWYLADHHFSSPRINMNFLLLSGLIYDTPINALYAEIWLQFIDFYSSAWAANVNTACYSFDLSLNHQGIVLSITGLNKRYLHELVGEFLNEYFVAHISMNGNSLSVLRNILISLRKTYKNLNYAPVWHQAEFAMYDIVKIPHFDRNLMFDIVNGLLASVDDALLMEIEQYVNDVLSSGFLIEALFHGNIDKTQVSHLVSVIRHSLALKQFTTKTSHNFHENLLKMDHLKLDMMVQNKRYSKFAYFGYNTNGADSNDMTQIWFQFSSNLNHIETCRVLLLARMMKSECFKVLRTQESLGYVANVQSKSSVGATNNINYLIILVASAHKSATYLNQRIFNFVHNHYYHKILLKLSQHKFDAYVNGTVNDLAQKYLRLSQQTSLIWDEIIGHTYAFKWKQQYIKILREITLQDMQQFYSKTILSKQSKHISIQLFHHNNNKQKIARGHRVVVTNTNRKDVLYFNNTKDLQKLNAAKYFDVY